MVEFIIKARAAPADAARFRAAIGRGQGVEYLADVIRSALFISQGHRADTVLSLVLEKSNDFSRILQIAGDSLGSVTDLHESSLLEIVADSLVHGANLGKEQSVIDSRGISVTTQSFEHLIKQRTDSNAVFLLDKDGTDIRDVELTRHSVFVMTDHTPMPKNTYKSLHRLGVSKLSLGPVMLHAAQCITLIHNEIDRRSR